ncbi:phosphoadenosine phosphosulfate reductase [Streptomyces kronopolitis]|uniref:phosphoadenosine phosphosulfate reductase n=1 Tax=Streptomyces kronopolitis TaxID=1612435 RepID=UPI0036AF2986
MSTRSTTGIPQGTITRGPRPYLPDYDYVDVQLSGGKDSGLMAAETMDVARRDGAEDLVWSHHASLGVVEWPSVTHGGTVWPSVAELAAQQSVAYGVPRERHVEVTRTKAGPGGTSAPWGLLSEIAAYGRFPRLGSPYCRKSAKESPISASWTLTVRKRRRELGRPVRILKVLGLRGDESPSRRDRPAYRNVLTNGARIVDEWLPIQDWRTPEVKEWYKDALIPYHWTYDSVPGAGDWLGTSRCSCSFCFLASKRDLVLSCARRPRLSALYAEVEAVRGDRFTYGWRMHDLIRSAAEAPPPGIVLDDDTPAFAALAAQVRAALHHPPRKEPKLARQSADAEPCAGCAAHT